jgi:hypothetical protein
MKQYSWARWARKGKGILHVVKEPFRVEISGAHRKKNIRNSAERKLVKEPCGTRLLRFERYQEYNLVTGRIAVWPLAAHRPPCCPSPKVIWKKDSNEHCPPGRWLYIVVLITSKLKLCHECEKKPEYFSGMSPNEGGMSTKFEVLIHWKCRSSINNEKFMKGVLKPLPGVMDRSPNWANKDSVVNFSHMVLRNRQPCKSNYIMNQHSRIQHTDKLPHFLTSKVRRWPWHEQLSTTCLLVSV